jgi:hypothetical protein
LHQSEFEDFSPMRIRKRIQKRKLITRGRGRTCDLSLRRPRLQDQGVKPLLWPNFLWSALAHAHWHSLLLALLVLRVMLREMGCAETVQTQKY